MSPNTHIPMRHIQCEHTSELLSFPFRMNEVVFYLCEATELKMHVLIHSSRRPKTIWFSFSILVVEVSLEVWFEL